MDFSRVTEMPSWSLVNSLKMNSTKDHLLNQKKKDIIMAK